MTRYLKYKKKRFNKRIAAVKKSLLTMVALSISMLFLGLFSTGSFSYFTAEYTSSFQLKNAVKEELVEIIQHELIYDQEKKCHAKQPVTVKNIFDYQVVIFIDGTEYKLNPGDEITHTQVVADKCGEFGEHTFKIVGYKNYFEHDVMVYVDKDLLNPCPQPPIDNANGRENDNGNGKHCGNQGNPVHDPEEKNNENINQSETEVNESESTEENSDIDSTNEEKTTDASEVESPESESIPTDEENPEDNKSENDDTLNKEQNTNADQSKQENTEGESDSVTEQNDSTTSNGTHQTEADQNKDEEEP